MGGRLRYVLVAGEGRASDSSGLLYGWVAGFFLVEGDLYD